MPTTAEVLRRLLEAHLLGRDLDPWLAFPQRTCCFQFGSTKKKPLPIGPFLSFGLWESPTFKSALIAEAVLTWSGSARTPCTARSFLPYAFREGLFQSHSFRSPSVKSSWSNSRFNSRGQITNSPS